MFIKIWQPITLYIDRMDWRAGHSTTTEETGAGHLPTKIARKAGHLMLAAGIDSHITGTRSRTLFLSLNVIPACKILISICKT